MNLSYVFLLHRHKQNTPVETMVRKYSSKVGLAHHLRDPPSCYVCNHVTRNYLQVALKFYIISKMSPSKFPPNLFMLVFISRTYYLLFKQIWALVTVRNSSCGNVMFLQVSVCPQGEVYIPRADTPPPSTLGEGGIHPARQTPPSLDRHPPFRVNTPQDGHCSGRNTSNWNAFLLTYFIVRTVHWSLTS